VTRVGTVRRLALGLAVELTVAAGSGSPLRAQPRPPGTARTDLQQHDLSTAGWETRQIRVDFAPGASFPRHTHPGEEIIYVLEGTLEYDIDGKAPLILKAGEVLFVPKGVVHAAKNPGTTPAAELGTYVVEKGKPLTEIAK